MKKKQQPSKTLVILIPLLLGVIIFINSLLSSLFFQKKDRLNIIISQETTSYYSIGLNDGVNYFVSFYPDFKVKVPGGYGAYRTGALTKLVSLEKKPDLFRKTYSMETKSRVDFYFYPSALSLEGSIYFGSEANNFSLPKFYMILFGSSNARFFDRLFIYSQLFGKTKGQFKILTPGNDFFDTYQGIFYKQTYRSEEKSVQILYSKSYETAQAVSQILEGEGIRVVDLSAQANEKERCEIVEDGKDYSHTAIDLASFFDCSLVKGKTDAYDIIVKLGEKEKDWEIN